MATRVTLKRSSPMTALDPKLQGLPRIAPAAAVARYAASPIGPGSICEPPMR